MTDSLSRLRAGLDRDEAIARKACLMVTMPGSERWQFDDMQVRADDRDHSLVVKHTWPNEGEHIARHDPSRVLRQAEKLREAEVIVRELIEVGDWWTARQGKALAELLAGIYTEDTTETGDPQ